MRARELIEYLKATRADIATFVWGPPGTGKSSIVRQVAEELHYDFMDVRLALLDPTDLRGIPVPENGSAKWLAPAFLPRKPKTLLFLDELNAAPPLVQASAYQLVLDRRVGEYVLPEDCMIVAAGNRSGDRAVVHRMPSPLANRFVHVNYEVHLEDWTEWAVRSEVRSEVIAYLNFKPSSLFVFNPEKEEHAFPTPRSWSLTSRILNMNLPYKIEAEAIEGAVGKGAAAEFNTFRKVYQKLPDPELVLSGKYTDVPEDTSVKYALVCAVAERVKTQPHVENVVKYADNLQPEFSVLLVKLVSGRHKEKLLQSPAFTNWTKKNKSIVL